MRFHLGPPPCSDAFQPELDPAWRPLREPNPVAAQVLGMVPAALLASVLVQLGYAFIPPGSSDIPESSLVQVALLLALLVAHEAAHGLAYPDPLSPSTIVGFMPRAMAPYVYRDIELSRERFMLILAAPTLALTVLPTALVIAGIQSWTLLAAAIGNALLAAADILGAAMIAHQIPRGARVRNRGWATWWRPAPLPS